MSKRIYLLEVEIDDGQVDPVDVYDIISGRFGTAVQSACAAGVHIALQELTEVAAGPLTRLRSLVNTNGTALPEATLCDIHYRSHRLRRQLQDQTVDYDRSSGWQVSTGNEQVACVICGQEAA